MNSFLGEILEPRLLLPVALPSAAPQGSLLPEADRKIGDGESMLAF